MRRGSVERQTIFRTVQQYIEGMALSFKCGRGSICRDFWDNHDAYTAEPFACPLSNDTVLPSRDCVEWGETETAAVLDGHNMAMSSAAAAVTATVHCTLLVTLLTLVRFHWTFLSRS